MFNYLLSSTLPKLTLRCYSGYMAVFSQPHYPPFGAPSVMDTAVIFSPELRQKFEAIFQVLIQGMENYQRQTGNVLPKDLQDFLDTYNREKTYFFERAERFVMAKFFLEREINLRLMLLSQNILSEIKNLQGTAKEADLKNAEIKRLVDKYELNQLSLNYISAFPFLKLLILSSKKQEPVKFKLEDFEKEPSGFSEYKGYIEDIDPKGGDYVKFCAFITELAKVQLEFYKALGFTYYEFSEQIKNGDFKKQIIQKFLEHMGDNVYQERLNKLKDEDLLRLKEKVESEFEKELLEIMSGGKILAKTLPKEVVGRVIKNYLEELRQKEELTVLEKTREQLQQILKKSPSPSSN